jgi:RNA-binding protein 39
LKPVFEAFGDVDFIDIHTDAATGLGLGFGYVQYKSETDARAALEALNGLEIAGRCIAITIVEQAQNESRGEMDDEGTGGMQLNAQSRAALMEKLGRGMFPSSTSTQPVSMPQQQAYVAPVVNVVRIQPSTCIVVKNMFDPKTETEADFDLDVRMDVEEEAAKFGELRHILVDKNSIGFVYVRMGSVQAATGLQQAFHGRFYASRQISAEFVVESIYCAKFPAAK